MLIGGFMTVYVDVLIFINAVVDYLLINLSSLITGIKIRNLRLVIASLTASLFSLAIFLPYLGIVAEFLIRIFSAIIICLIGYGYINIKRFIKTCISFLAVSIAFNGIMSAVWFIFKPNGMVLSNSVIYFDISVLEMIFFSVASYLIIRLVLSIIRRVTPYAQRCKVQLRHDENFVEITAMVDSGNSLKDVYLGRHVIITDINIATQLFGDLTQKNKLLLPVKTVGGLDTVEAYPCKQAYINDYSVGAVLVAVSKETIDGDYMAIVNPEILNDR